jgi:hypothetical protein
MFRHAKPPDPRCRHRYRKLPAQPGVTVRPMAITGKLIADRPPSCPPGLDAQHCRGCRGRSLPASAARACKRHKQARRPGHPRLSWPRQLLANPRAGDYGCTSTSPARTTARSNGVGAAASPSRRRPGTPQPVRSRRSSQPQAHSYTRLREAKSRAASPGRPVGAAAVRLLPPLPPPPRPPRPPPRARGSGAGERVGVAP